MSFDAGAASAYKSRSQRARILTERWVADRLYCPACGADHLRQFPANRAAADFECPECREQFELKSGTSIGASVPDGAYATLLHRLAADDNPNLILLRRDRAETGVVDLQIVPRRFFSAAVVEPRPPLGPTAKRAGWIGCTIRLDRMPSLARVSVVANRQVRPKTAVCASWSGVARLLGPDLDARAWLPAVLTLVESFGTNDFALADIYAAQEELQRRFPANRNVRAKIRQQLQRLRDAGVLRFLGQGRYRRTNDDTHLTPPDHIA